MFIIVLQSVFSLPVPGTYYNIYNKCGFKEGCCISVKKENIYTYGGMLQLGRCDLDQSMWLMEKGPLGFTFKNKLYNDRYAGILGDAVQYNTLQAVPKVSFSKYQLVLDGDDTKGYLLQFPSNTSVHFYMNSSSSKNYLRKIDDQYARFFFK